MAPRFDKGFRVWKGSLGMEKVQEYGNFIEYGKEYRKGVRVCKRCQGMKRHQGMGKV